MRPITIIIDIPHARRVPEKVASGNVKLPKTDIRPKYGNALHIGGCTGRRLFWRNIVT